jgi:hypothetical protein
MFLFEQITSCQNRMLENESFRLYCVHIYHNIKQWLIYRLYVYVMIQNLFGDKFQNSLVHVMVQNFPLLGEKIDRRCKRPNSSVGRAAVWYLEGLGFEPWSGCTFLSPCDIIILYIPYCFLVNIHRKTYIVTTYTLHVSQELEILSNNQYYW